MRLQLIPLGLVVEYVVGQIDDHLADEVVGAVAHIVPQCDLEKGDTLELHAWKGGTETRQTSSRRPLRSQRRRPEYRNV